MSHLENLVKSYRTFVPHGGSHSKKTSFRCPLVYPRKSSIILLFYLFKDREIRTNSKTLDLRESWETSPTSLSYRWKTKRSPKKTNILAGRWLQSSGPERALSCQVTLFFEWGALQLTTKFLPLLAILLFYTYRENAYVISNENL